VRCLSLSITALTLALATLAPPAPPIPTLGPLTFSEMQRIAALPEAEQLRSAHQKRLQEWFLFHIDRFQTQLSGTAIGSQVRLGDLAAYRRRFPPPTGGGGEDWSIVWVDTNLGPTKHRGEPFRLPRDKVDLYYKAGNPKTRATAWHEVQHGVLCEHELSAPGLLGGHREHFYTDSYAEPTVEWLARLTGALRFEELVRRASEEAEAYRARGEAVTFEVEHHLWSQVHTAWRMAWPITASIRGLSDSLRDEYRMLGGVEVPAVEDVIRFYMEGGIRSVRGSRITVPEWVLNPDPVRATVEIRHDPRLDVREVRGGLLSHRFAFRLEEVYRSPGAAIFSRRKVTRGTLTIQLETEDDPATLAVGLGARKITGIPVAGAASLRRFSLPLDSLKAEILRDQPFSITFVHRHPEQVQGTRTFKVVADFNDRADASGPALYHPSRAAFWIDLQGAAGRPGLPPGAPPVPGAAAPTGPGWTFQQRKVDAARFALAPTDVASSYSFQVLSSQDGRVAYRDEFTSVFDGKDLGALRDREARWSVPPAFLPAGKPLPLALGIRRLRDKPPAGAGKRGCDLRMLTYLRPEAARKDLQAIQPAQTVAVPATSDDVRENWPTPDPASFPGYDTLVLRVQLVVDTQRGERLSYSVDYEYGVAAAPAATTFLRVQLPASSVDRDNDNVPPQRGERKGITPGQKDGGDDDHPPKAGAEVNWYVHPTGAFRFRVPHNWPVFRQHLNPLRPDPNYDHMGDGIDVNQIIVWREFLVVKTPDGGLAEKLETLVKQHPEAVSARGSLAGVTALMVTYKTANGYASTHYYLLRQGKRYYLHTYGEPAGTDFSRPPPVPDRLLRTLEFPK
jgi:hypothetical protein